MENTKLESIIVTELKELREIGTISDIGKLNNLIDVLIKYFESQDKWINGR